MSAITIVALFTSTKYILLQKLMMIIIIIVDVMQVDLEYIN